MRKFWNLMRSRAVPVLGGAVLAVLALPAAALAGGFSAPSGVHHHLATASGGSNGVAILLGVLAAAVLTVVTLSRAGGERKGFQRPARSSQRKPAGVAS